MSKEISRDALLIYLNDIKIMETIIFKSKKSKEELDRQENKLGYTIIAPTKPTEPSKPKKEWGKLIFLGIIILLFFDLGFKKFANTNFGTVCMVISGCLGIFALFWLKVGFINVSKEYDEKMKKYSALMEQYNYSYGEYSKRIQNDKQRIISLRKSINDNITFVQGKLQNAYNANIIPAQFRNIEGIYYLYDYLSTSNENLTNALLQANLESIKQKLDKMISLQGTMIVQQAQANKTLFEQNQQILETARNIENNSAIAAQYSQISAINSEVSLMLQAESLAYQEADFWLRYN